MLYIYGIIIFIALNSIFLISYYLYKGREVLATKYFFGLYAILIVLLAEQVVLWYFINKIDWWILPEFPVRFLIGPFLYLYVSTYINPRFRPNLAQKIQLWSPFILDIVFSVALSIWASTQNLSLEDRYRIGDNHHVFLVHTSLAIISNLFFSIKAYQQILQFIRNLKDVYGAIDFKKFKWILYITLTSVVLWLVWLGYLGAEFYNQVSREAYMPLFLLLGIFILGAGYFAVLKPYDTYFFNSANFEINELSNVSLQPSPFAMGNSVSVSENETTINGIEESYIDINLLENNVNQDVSLPISPTVEQIEKKKIDNDELLKIQIFKDLFVEIEKIMSSSRPFTDTEFSLPALAKLLGQSSLNTSKAIKYGSGKNFYTYVNEWRVKLFIDTLQLPENESFTLIALAQKCGFNSKATFHKYFKEMTGKTPAQYKEENIQESV